MNSRERVNAAFDHRTPDRTPVFEYVMHSPVAQAVLGHPYEDFGADCAAWYIHARNLGGYDKALTQYAADRVELALRLEHDLIYCVPEPPPENTVPSVPPPVFDDPVDAVEYNNRLMERNLEKPFEGFRVYTLIQEELGRRGFDLPVYAPAFKHGIWTNVNLMQTMALEPDTAHRHFELCTALAIRQIKTYIDLDIDIIGIGGDFAGNMPLISPAMYRDFIMPELKKLTAYIRENGKRSVNASDGMIWDALDYFLTGSGVDGYGEVDAGAGMDLKRLKERYGNRITFLGNIDAGNLLSFGTEEEIKAATVRCIQAGWGSGGHIFTASNAITASVPLKNYFTMVNAYREYFDLKLLGCRGYGEIY
jgi:uroporphyrinogen decarboxylase